MKLTQSLGKFGIFSEPIHLDFKVLTTSTDHLELNLHKTTLLFRELHLSQ